MDDYVSYTLEDSPAPVPTSDKSGLDIQPTTATDTNVPSTGFVIPAVESTSSTPSTSSTSAFSAFSKPEGGNLFTGSATSFQVLVNQNLDNQRSANLDSIRQTPSLKVYLEKQILAIPSTI